MGIGGYLKEAVDFEPVGASAVARARLGHADEEALAQTARLARRPVLLVDDALAAVLALADRRHVAVRPAEERLPPTNEQSVTIMEP